MFEICSEFAMISIGNTLSLQGSQQIIIIIFQIIRSQSFGNVFDRPRFMSNAEILDDDKARSRCTFRVEQPANAALRKLLTVDVLGIAISAAVQPHIKQCIFVFFHVALKML